MAAVTAAACEHSGFWSCETRYDRANHRLAYRMLCDECHAEMRSLGEEGYEPRPQVRQPPRASRA